MSARDDEREEWRRRDLERARLAARDRLYDKVPDATDIRFKKRKYRVEQMLLRMQLRTRAILIAIIDRDAHDGLPSLFEILIDLYLQKYPIDESQIPSEEELVEAYLKKQDKKDADPNG